MRKYLPLILLLIITTNFSQGEIEYDGTLTIRLEHSISNLISPEYSLRGQIVVRSLYSGASSIEQQPVSEDTLKDLLKLGENEGFYRLKAYITSPDGKTTILQSSLPAKCLINSRLSDLITIQLDHVGHPVAVSVSLRQDFCNGLEDGKFCSQIAVRHMEPGPLPDTASYLQRLEREKQQRNNQQNQDNRNFFQKYWMYILPIGIFLLLSGGGGQDSGGNQQ